MASIVEGTCSTRTHRYTRTNGSGLAQHLHQWAVLLGFLVKSVLVAAAAILVACSPAKDLPNAPADVLATAGDASATVGWTPPSHPGHGPLTYTVTASPGGSHRNVTSASTVIDGLANGTSYTFTVHASNTDGTGPESAPSNAVVPGGVPSAPAQVVAKAGDQQAEVSWTAPASNGSPITHSVVTAQPGGSTCQSTTSNATCTGLTNGTTYTFSVHAANAVGDGPESAPSNTVTPAAPATVPDAPGWVTAVSTVGGASLAWTEPGANGSPIVGYTATASPGGLKFASATTSATCLGLTNGVAYTFTVHATNAIGSSPESAASNAVTPLIVPGAPESVRVTGFRDHVEIYFSPSVTGFDSGNTYSLSYSPQTPGVTAVSTSDVVGSRFMRASGLQDGVIYSFTVMASNAAGTSPPSQSVSGARTCAANSDCPADFPSCLGSICQVPCTPGGGCACVISGCDYETGASLDFCGCTTAGACIPDSCTHRSQTCESEDVCHTQHRSTAMACSTDNYQCVQCVTDGDCFSYASQSATVCRNNQCAGCASDQDCAGPTHRGPMCMSLYCDRCSADADCAGNSRGPHCASDGMCVP